MKSFKIIPVLLAAVMLTAPGLSAQQVLSEPTVNILHDGKQLEDQGKLLEARDFYEKILQDPSLTAEEIAKAAARYESLNEQLLFSRFKTASSLIYEVKPGDSLYKIAKNHKTTPGLIRRINSLSKSTIYPGQELKIETGTFSVVVDKSENVLSLFYDGRPVKRYRVATGAEDKTPTGEFEIVNKLVNPTWYHDGKVFPPESPENILGTRWMGFDLKSYGIHGTTLPDSIGKNVSAGCIRMLNAEVEELYEVLPVGTKVRVVN